MRTPSSRYRRQRASLVGVARPCALLALLLFSAADAQARGGHKLRQAKTSVTPISEMACPKLGGSGMVYGVGSSTLGSTLGPALAEILEKRGVKFRKWGKASTGLARPDYHDWAKEIRNVSRQWKPSVFLIALGSNDFQALRVKKGWVSPFKDSHRWRSIYAKRVDRILAAASGKKRDRAVIWITPNVFEGKKPERIGKWIHDILLDRIQHFEGPAFVVDTYRATTASDGKPKATFKIPGKKGSHDLFASDGLHLSTRAVHSLMRDPALELIERCVRAPQKR